MATGNDGNDGTRSRKKHKDDQAHDDDQNEPDESQNDTQLTLALVDQIKTTLKKQFKQDELITEEDIEIATYNARRKLNPDIDEWENNPSINIDKDSRNLLYQSLAYAQTRKQLARILQTKQKEAAKNPSTPPIKKPCTSLKNSFEALTDLRERLKETEPKNLFAAVLNISEDKIDSADRMFFSEASRFVRPSTQYTLLKAHEQVQAIRLMHYETEDEEKLRAFINDCSNFDEAYACLRNNARDRVSRVSGRRASAAQSSSSTSFPKNKSERSIVMDPYDEKTKNNVSPSSSSSRKLENSYHDATQSGYRSREDQSGHDEDDEHRSDKVKYPRPSRKT